MLTTTIMRPKSSVTKKEYQTMIQRIDLLADANPGSKEADELKVLTRNLIAYLKKTVHKA